MNQTNADTNTSILLDGRISHADRGKVFYIRAVAYWASTSVAALAFAGMGVANLSNAAPIMNGLAHLGYPAYFATILGTWKLLAAAALLTPGLPRVKEWAYAGMFFTLTGAAASHAFNHDAAVSTLTPLVLLGVSMTSRGLRWQDEALRRGSGPSGVENHVGH